MAAVPTLKFNFKDIADLTEDLRASPQALKTVIRTVTAVHLRKLRNAAKAQAPSRVQRNLGFSVPKRREVEVRVWAILGFLRKKRSDSQTAILANVVQKGFAETGARGQYGHRNAENIWIPLPAAGLNLTPTRFFTLPGTFIRRSKAGNKIAFQRSDRGTLWPMFLLRQRVRAPGHPIDFEGAVESEMPEITEDIKETIVQVLEARGRALRSIDGL